MSSPPSSAAVAEQSFTFWQVVRQSLRGEHLDFTSLPLNRAVLLLAVPMVLEMLMESLFAVADVFWVSHLGSDAIAIVGITESVMALIYAVAIGISIAGSAVVARRIGEKDPEAAAEAAGQVILLGIALSTVLGAVLSYFAGDILELMGGDAKLVAQGTDFARIMFGGNATVFLIFLINSVFRGAGDAVLAMRTLWLANALNIVLGPCFIFGLGPFPELGVTGAAVATNIGRGIGVLYQVWHLYGNHSRLNVKPHHFKPELRLMRTIVVTSINGTAQLLIGTASWIVLFKILATFGSAALAGFTIAMRIVTFAVLPAYGLANAGATLVGQNLGAGRPDRAEQAVNIATRFNTMFLGTVGVVFIVFASQIVSAFASDADALREGAQALWIVSLGFPLYAMGMGFGAAFNGAGDTWTPTRLNFFCFWLGQIPVAWILGVSLNLGPTGVFISLPLAFSALALASWRLFRKGRWKHKRV
jgi:putative MATE family efflux protein